LQIKQVVLVEEITPMLISACILWVVYKYCNIFESKSTLHRLYDSKPPRWTL